MSEQVEKPPEIWAAEARKIDAEIKKLEAEACAAKSESKLKQAEARKQIAEAEDAELEVKKTRRQVEKILYEYEKELCEDEHHHVYRFTGSVGEQSVGKCMDQLRIWMRQEDHLAPEDKSKIEIWFNSPGGGVIEGMALFDFIQMVRRSGHHVTTGTIGYAASMGGILLQAGDERIMGAEAYILIHEISAGAVGKMGEIEDQVKFMELIMKRVVNIFAERTSMSPQRIKSGMKRKDWWIDSTEALKLGLVDKVI